MCIRISAWSCPGKRRIPIMRRCDICTTTQPITPASSQQRITMRRPNGLERGIKQGSLYLQAARDYDLRLVLKGEGQALTVQLGEETWRIDAVGPEWTVWQHQFTAAGENPLGELSLTISEGSLWIGCASLMPSDNIAGFRADVIEALRDWSPTQLRWPGGNFVSAYHWQLGIGDRDRRPAYLDPAWWLWESNDVGTDEFCELCRLVGAEPVLTANMGNGTAEEAAAWVEYCNGAADTTYGRMRALMATPSPMMFEFGSSATNKMAIGKWATSMPRLMRGAISNSPGRCAPSTPISRCLAWACRPISTAIGMRLCWGWPGTRWISIACISIPCARRSSTRHHRPKNSTCRNGGLVRGRGYAGRHAGDHGCQRS